MMKSLAVNPGCRPLSLGVIRIFQTIYILEPLNEPRRRTSHRLESANAHAIAKNAAFRTSRNSGGFSVTQTTTYGIGTN